MGIPITLDCERNLIFSLNVLEKCVEKFESMDNVLNAFVDIASLKWTAVQMLNEDAEIWNDEHADDKKTMLTEKQLGRLIEGVGGIQEFQEKVRAAMLKGLPEDKVAEIEAEGKNLIAAQREQILNRQQRRSRR